MTCTNCNNPLPAGAKFCQGCGTKVQPKGINIDQNVGTVKGGEVTGAVLGSGAANDTSIAVDQDVNTVQDGGVVTGAVIGGQNGTINVGGQHHHGDGVQGDKHEVNTGGGAHIQGNVNTGGDFVGRDKVVNNDSQNASPSFCYNCGTKLARNANFCAKCGTKIAGEN